MRGCGKVQTQIFESMAGSTPSCQPRASVAVDTLSPRPLLASLAKKALGAAVAVGTLSAGSAQALTWNWSFTADLSSGQGTFTTAGPTPVADSIETITAITGTYTRFGNTSENGTYEINGLDSYIATNTFIWDGSGTSPIITDLNGIAFNLKGTDNGVRIYYGGSNKTGFGPVDTISSSFSSRGAPVIYSSSLSPVSPTASVPGPLPILGLAAAFGFSRKLRKRITLHKGTDAVSTSTGS